MQNIVIGDKTFELIERPKHRSVQEVQDIMTSWMMENVNMDKLDLEEDFEKAVQISVMKDKTLAVELIAMQRTLPYDQTIMLATGISHKELQRSKADMFEDEFRELYEASKEVIGGSAADFFGFYDSGTSSKQETEKEQDESE